MPLHFFTALCGRNARSQSTTSDTQALTTTPGTATPRAGTSIAQSHASSPLQSPLSQRGSAASNKDYRNFSETESQQISQIRSDLALHHPDIIHNTEQLSTAHQYDQLLADVARCLQRDLHRVYPHEPMVADHFNHNTRYTVASLRSDPPTQSNWVHHVFGLLRLRSVLNAHQVSALQQHVSHANGDSRQHETNRSMSTLQTTISQLQGRDVSDALLMLYLQDTRNHRRGSAHNTHLSSVALQTVTGLVYHPLNNLITRPEHGRALPSPLIENHPGSFKQFPFVLLARYCEALKNNVLEDFFNSAFIRQRPCYEDIQENILNHGGVQVHDHPRPAWNPAWSLNDNLLGQFAWVQRQTLIRKLNAEGKDPSRLSAQEWDALESSPAFAEELKLQSDVLWLQLREVVPQALHTEAHQWLIKTLKETE